MKVAGIYSFNQGKEVIETQFATELHEVREVIARVDSVQLKTKTSREKTMLGRTLYSPPALNKAFRIEFEARNWQKHKVFSQYQYPRQIRRC